MSDTILGVLIGSGIAILGNAGQFLLAWIKESRQFKRQRESERETWERDSREKERALLREIYQNAILALSLFLKIKEPDDPNYIDPTSREFELLNDCHRWVSPLCVRHPSKTFLEAVEAFTFCPERYSAIKLREMIVSMVAAEVRLSTNPPPIITERKEARTGYRAISFSIAEDYRRKRLTEGVELPAEFAYEKCSLAKLTHRQRSYLLTIFAESGDGNIIPASVTLRIPAFDPMTKEFGWDRKWEAKIDPHPHQSEAVLATWEADCDRCLAEPKDQESPPQ